MRQSEITKLLKSGNFTIVYWDRGIPTIYKGKWDIDKECERDDYATMEKSRVDAPMYEMNGYAPDIVIWLARSLGGHVDSI